MLHPTLVKFLVRLNGPSRNTPQGSDLRDYCRLKRPGNSRLLQLFGLKYLGHGCFAMAFLMRDGRVLKIGNEEDDGYAFNVWAKANRGETGVPDVYEVQRVEGGWYCIMEHVTTAEELGEYRNADEEAEEAAYAFANETGGSVGDRHSGNWGFTADGRCVILDPTGCSSRIGLPAAVVMKRSYGPQQRRAARWH